MSDHDVQKQYLRAGSTADGPYALRIDPEQAGFGDTPACAYWS